MAIASLRKDQIDLAPVLLGGRALGGPVGRVIQLIRHLGRPVAADVAVEQIALDRLAQARRPARRDPLPSLARRPVSSRSGSAAAAVGPVRCSPTTSGSVARSMRARLAVDRFQVIHGDLVFEGARRLQPSVARLKASRSVFSRHWRCHLLIVELREVAPDCERRARRRPSDTRRSSRGSSRSSEGSPRSVSP